MSSTIAAIATPPGRGGVAIVRVSGPEAFAVAERLTGRRPHPRRVSLGSIRVRLESNRVGLGWGRDPASTLTDPNSAPTDPKLTLGDPKLTLTDPKSTLIDTAIVLAFQAPHSYTGEDVVEFQCHGGTVTPRRVLEACFAAGARLARRGEFTERAFLNGRITYEQAEGVLDLVDAKTDRAADAALEGLAGARRAEMRAIYDELVALSSKAEHALDVNEEELPEGFLGGLEHEAESIAARITSALRRMKEGRILREGALVVIAGEPNAGKSSLMNALLGERRAIVSDVPGTTRDSIEEWLDVGGWPVRLVDTAGLRDTSDAIEGEGVERARELIEKADVVVRLTPADSDLAGGTSGTSGTDRTYGTDGTGVVIEVLSKFDLNPSHPSSDRLRGSLRSGDTFPIPHSLLPVSAKTGEGLDALRCAIAAELAQRADETRADGSEVDAVGRDGAFLAEALSWLSAPGPDLVLLANRLRSAAERLGAAVGAEYSADMLDALFSRFCVGK